MSQLTEPALSSLLVRMKKNATVSALMEEEQKEFKDGAAAGVIDRAKGRGRGKGTAKGEAALLSLSEQ